MRSLLKIFLVGQLFLFSFVFSQSIYTIYELNNLGDSSLNTYKVEEFSSNALNDLYSLINNNCLEGEKCQLQIIKTPVSEGNKFNYAIYHSNIDAMEKPSSLSDDTVFTYNMLTREDFIDNDGVFSTDLSETSLNGMSKEIGIIIKPYNEGIPYQQILISNSLNFLILFVLTFLVLLIYTFTRIKINAIKKMLGYSNFEMVKSTMKEFILIEATITITILILHFLYFLLTDSLILRYFLLLIPFLFLVVLLNIIFLLLTQFSLRFIDIQLMIKNKVFSSRSNTVLYIVKIVLILIITISISSLFSTYKEYQEIKKDLERYTQLNQYFTSTGYNSEEYDKATMDADTLAEYGSSVKGLYNYYNEQEKLYVNDAYALTLLSSSHLTDQGNYSKGLPISENNIVVNKRYIKDFLNLTQEDGSEVNSQIGEQPTLLVPVKYKLNEVEIKDIYIQKYNDLLNYNNFYGVPSNYDKTIDKINIIYLENNQNHELLGQSIPGKPRESGVINDPIILIDQGEFGSLYYFDLLNSGDLYFKLQQAEDFSKKVSEYGLDSLVIVGTLFTPFMESVNFTEFVLYNSIVFTILFFFTLIFIMYISNYIDIVSNSKRYAIQYIYGLSIYKTLSSHFLVYIILLCAISLTIFINFNIAFYLLMLLFDILLLVYLHNRIVIKNLYKITKGGL